MSLSLPFGLGSGVDAPAIENTYQQFDPQGRWQVNGVDPSADQCIYPRLQASSMQGKFGTYVRHLKWTPTFVDEIRRG